MTSVSITTQVVRQPFFTDRLVTKLKEKENALHCVYLNDFNLVIAAFVLQSNEAKNWHDGLNKARHIFSKLKLDIDGHPVKIVPQQQGLINNYSITESISIKKSPLGSSIGILYIYIYRYLYNILLISFKIHMFFFTSSL